MKKSNLLSEKKNVELTFRRCLGGVLRKVKHSQAMTDTEITILGKQLMKILLEHLLETR